MKNYIKLLDFYIEENLGPEVGWTAFKSEQGNEHFFCLTLPLATAVRFQPKFVIRQK